jgi:hypothetical protein
LADLEKGAQALLEKSKYEALYIIPNHIHPGLKSEYMMEENPHELWKNLKQHYEQQKATVLPKATHEWKHLRLQDFKTVHDYNHVVHKLSQKLWFCNKEPTEAEKIENTFSTMLPSERILTLRGREVWSQER